MAHMVAGGTLHPSWTQLKPVEDIGLYCEHIFRLDILQACEAGVFFLKQFSLQLEVNSNEKNWIKGISLLLYRPLKHKNLALLHPPPYCGIIRNAERSSDCGVPQIPKFRNLVLLPLPILW